MTSPLGAAIARWTATAPGPIKSATQEGVFAASLAASGIKLTLLGAEPGVTKPTPDMVATWAEALDRAGYKPTIRSCTDPRFANERNECHQINFPERQSGQAGPRA